MVIPRKWKVVSGGVTVAVALGAGAAIAQPGKSLPTLQDVAESSLDGTTTTTFVPDDGGVLRIELTAESPLSDLSEPSEPSPESEPSEPSPESEESEPSPESEESEPSPESEESEPSPESEESEPSPESEESEPSPESPDSDD